MYRVTWKNDLIRQLIPTVKQEHRLTHQTTVYRLIRLANEKTPDADVINESLKRF